MSAESIPVQALIEHREFVRNLARRLLGDEHAAEDVVQDAALAALRSRSSASSPLEAPRAWISQLVRRRALNEKRERARRASREEQVARHEATENVDLAEKLELESRVVRAVLSLREPYRAVMLGRYYQGLSTKELAARQGVTESSVRSQEARALELLRRELDERFEGGRAAWSAALVGFLEPPKVSLALGSAAAWVVGGAAVLGVGLWWLDATLEPSSQGRVPLDFASLLAVEPISAESNPEPKLEPERASTRTQAPAGMSFDGVGPSVDELRAMSIPNLLQLALQLQRELRERMLTPDPALFAAHSSGEADATGGVCRLLDREFYGRWSEHETLLGIREGGSAYSFTDRSHDHDTDVQLIYAGKLLRAGGTGACVDVGKLELGDVPAAAGAPVLAWSAEQCGAWRALWAPAREFTQALHGRELGRALNPVGVEPVAGRTYVLRSHNARAHDVLVALRIVAKDQESVVLAWRLLNEWPLEEPRAAPASPRAPFELLVTDTPAWIVALETPALRSVFDRLREVGSSRLLGVDPSTSVDPAQRGGVVRLLDGEWLGALVKPRGAGSSCSFVGGAHDDRRGIDLALRDRSFATGLWAGDVGLLLDLGEIDPAAIDPARPVPPPSLSARQLETWDLVWGLHCAPEGSPEAARGALLTQLDERRLRELGNRKQVEAVRGHTYLLRSMSFDEHDLTIVFRSIAADAYGHTLEWRILRELPVPKRAR